MTRSCINRHNLQVTIIKESKLRIMPIRILLIGIFSSLFSFAQAQEIIETEKSMSRGVKNGFYLEFPGAEQKHVKDLWKDYLKEYAKKVKDKDDEYYTEECKVPLINGSAEITIYSEILKEREQATLYTWVDLGGAYLNTEDHPIQAEGLDQFLYDFYIIVRKDVINRELEDQEDELKDLNKDLEKLVDKNDDYHRDIEKAQEKIRKAEMEIEKNLREQDDKRIEIEKQKRKVDALIKKLNDIGKSS